MYHAMRACFWIMIRYLTCLFLLAMAIVCGRKKESKLELAASMIRQVMPEFLSKEHVIILCDSWYTKKKSGLYY